MDSLEQKKQKITNSLKNSVTIKIAIIAFLMILLLIPSAMIQDTIHDRERLNQKTTKEVSALWSGDQVLCGPVLTIPVLYEYQQKEESIEEISYWHILPKQLDLSCEVLPKKLKRGIYEVVVYASTTGFSGSFQMDHSFPKNNLKEIQYDKAFLTIGISDLRGIEEEILVDWNGSKLAVAPGSQISDIIPSGITVYLDEIELEHTDYFDFNFDLQLQGSQNISFAPLGETTNVHMSSNWSSPSFAGNFLPDERKITETGFTAKWKILQLNRNFPQHWLNSAFGRELQQSSFGVNLILPMDDYQKSLRSAKYALMTIALTFLIFFLVEIKNKRKIHPLQYGLVGMALCLFYILLVSISEHSNFNFAYLISSIAIIGIISLYSISVFKVKKITMILAAILMALYGFVFITLQLADYALLMGSIGLTAILAMTMYFTRKIDWHHINMDR